MERTTFKTADLARIALGAALITVCAWITVPFTVPFTMQLFGVFFSLVLLGGRDGMLAVAVYLLLGAIGIPVFSGGAGGFSVLIGMTGGYLWGMLLIGAVYRIGMKLLPKSLWTEIALLLFGLVLCYLLGTVWFSALNRERDFVSSLLICVVPFLLPDLLKLALAVVLGRKLRQRLQRA